MHIIKYRKIYMSLHFLTTMIIIYKGKGHPVFAGSPVDGITAFLSSGAVIFLPVA